MDTISKKRIDILFNAFSGKIIAVIGDLMVDQYIWGSVARISPEAPVPVVDVESESARLGGAANVANNIKSLGATPLLIGVVGNDDNGTMLKHIFNESGFEANGIIQDDARPTTVKTRVIADDRHIVRIDRESRENISPVVQEKILSALRQNIERIDGIILEDYNKGVMTEELIGNIIRLANERNIIITVDPKLKNFFAYKNVTLFKPNMKETEDALGMKFPTDEKVEKAGAMLRERLNAKNVLLTRSENGMSLFQTDGTVTHIPTKARRVADVSGAGDTVIATLTLALASGGTMQESAMIANEAGGIVVGEVGIVPISKEVLRQSLMNQLQQ